MNLVCQVILHWRDVIPLIGLFRYIKIQLDSESVRTKTKESG